MKNIAALEKYLTKNVLKGVPGAEAIRDFIRAKGRRDIIARVGTAVPPGGISPTATHFPGVTAQKMLNEADEGLDIARDALPREFGPGKYGYGEDARNELIKWNELRDRKINK